MTPYGLKMRCARRAPKGSLERDFYVWSDTAEKYQEARIIFQDFETSNWAWDPVAKAYYWHRFYSHQPDLNYDHPLVRELQLLLFAYLLEKAIEELHHELNHRPDYVKIPLQLILQLISES